MRSSYTNTRTDKYDIAEYGEYTTETIIMADDDDYDNTLYILVLLGIFIVIIYIVMI